jgi:hypothetical protein
VTGATSATPISADTGPRLLRGGPIATGIREQVAADVVAFRDEHGYAPALAVVVVGKDAPSAVYLHKILDGCRLVGKLERGWPADARAGSDEDELQRGCDRVDATSARPGAGDPVGQGRSRSAASRGSPR